MANERFLDIPSLRAILTAVVVIVVFMFLAYCLYSSNGGSSNQYWLKVGDSFILARSPIRDRIGTIIQILSKYTRRFQVTGGQMELKFPGQTIIWTLHVPPAEKLTVADIQPMLDTIKARSEVVARLRDIYRTTAITLNMYGAKLGQGACEALFDLVTSEEDFVRCAQATTDAL